MIKRLHLFVLKSFLPLFAMTFFIVLFIVLMQFLWKYIDDLVGKGLSLGVLGELFFYAAVSMVPMALPLAILLASLMTFGNFGEKFELTAMKASGISLLRVMAPLIVLISGVAVGAFFFQNDILPKAQVKMWTLLFSMRQKSPELEIPEGVFYDQIPGYNLYVEHKDRDNGMLHDVMIYDVSRGGDNSTILLADSARMAMTAGNTHLYLHLWTGEQFENLRDQQAASAAGNVPFRRESFADKEILIPFDANFNRMNEDGMRKQYVGKNIAELRHTIDSVSRKVDSVGRVYSQELVQTASPLLPGGATVGASSVRHRSAPGLDGGSARASGEPMQSRGGNERVAGAATQSRAGSGHGASAPKDEAKAAPIDIDSLVRTLPAEGRASVMAGALRVSRAHQSDLQFRMATVSEDKRNIRRHEIELIKKFTLSVACLIFFFIGAPLGAIIRKGGLGTPLVISVLLFLFYYIIDNTGYKMARDGRWDVYIGMWLSTAVLFPLGVYVTWKAMNDSAVFDKDVYVRLLDRLTGRRHPRSVAYKEVIMRDISLREAHRMVQQLWSDASRLEKSLSAPMGYLRWCLTGMDARRVRELGAEIDETIEYLLDCRDSQVVRQLEKFPVLRSLWLYRPSLGRRWVGWVLALCLPVTVPLYLAAMRERGILLADLKRVCTTCKRIDTDL